MSATGTYVPLIWQVERPKRMRAMSRIGGCSPHPESETSRRTPTGRPQWGSLWVGTSDGLYHLYANPIEQYGAADGLGPVNSLAVGSSGLWVNIFSRGTYLQQDGVWTRRAELDR